MNAVPRRRPGTAKSRRRRRRFWIGAALLILIAPGAIKPLCGAETNISPAAPWLVIEKVIVDGEPATTNALPPDGVITLSPGPHRMSFQFGPAAGGDAERPLRLRYRLEGTDEGWQEAGGAMRFTVRLTDTNNDPFAYQDFTATHDSAGWDGDPAKSIFSYRREILTVPHDILFVSLMLASGLTGGYNTDTLGMMVIDDVKISIIPNTPEAKEELLYQCDFENGVNLDSEAGTPADWSRSTRLHPKMHVVVRAGPDPQNHALAVRDEHPRIIAVWNGRPPLDIRPKRGDKLVLEWKEMFTVGAGGTQTVSYRNIPPGRHVFRVMAVTPLGAPTGHSTGLTIIVPEFPFWRSAKFITWLIALTGFILLAQAVWLMRQRLKRQVERLQWQQAVEHERTRIARDIHDDLGTSLTRIAILSKSPRETADLKSISAITGEMTRTMDEIVWAVNPKKDSLDGLTNYLGAYAQELLSTANLRCRLDLPLRLPQWNLPAELRHNVFLAFKEALNNVLKHSGASEVHIALAVKPTHFVLTVKDNGRGFQPGLAPAAGVPASNTGGHGLANMRSRMEKIGGQFNLASSPDQGTTVSFTIKPSRMNDGAA